MSAHYYEFFECHKDMNFVEFALKKESGPVWGRLRDD